VIEIDGQQAYIVGRLPGQDFNRQVFIVNDGILYRLHFIPDNPQEIEAYQQMETLYAAVLGSLRFLPDRLAMPPITSMINLIYQLERAVEARSTDDIARLLGDEFIILNWTNPGATSMPYGRNEAVQVVLKDHTPSSPNLNFESGGNWPNVQGSPELFTGYFPNEVVMPVLVRGWGAQGSDEAVVIIARRNDGSMYWRGVLTSQGSFHP
jgi:hypothetical protein